VEESIDHQTVQMDYSIGLGYVWYLRHLLGDYFDMGFFAANPVVAQGKTLEPELS